MADSSHATSFNGKLRLIANGAAEVELDLVARNSGGHAQKEAFRTLPADQKDQRGRGFANALFPGARVRSVEFKNLSDRELPFTLSVALTAPRLLRPSGDGLRLAGVLQPSLMVRRYGGPA